MKMLVTPAPGHLRSAVTEFWALRGRPNGRYAGLPKPWVELVVSLSGLHRWQAGPTEPAMIYRGGWVTPLQDGPRYAETCGELHLIGARLSPDAAVALFGQKLPGGPPIPLDALIGSEAETLYDVLHGAANDGERLASLARWLSDRLGDEASWLPHTHQISRGGWRTDALADLLGLSPRGLRKRFHNRLGVGPKFWLQLSRFDALLKASLSSGSLADTAVALGYSDQAHMTTEFSRFAGTPPGHYLRLRTESAAPEGAPHFVPRQSECRFPQA